MKLDKIFVVLKFRGLAKFISDTKIGQKKMQTAEKVCVSTLLQKEDSVTAAARDIRVSREAVELKSKHHELFHNVSTKTIRHRLQKDLGLPGRPAVKKSTLTAAMKKKRLNFCQKY